MYLDGKIIEVGKMRQGQSARGEWAAQEFVIETEEQYPKHMSFDVFSIEKINAFALQQGMLVRVFFEIDARKGQDNGRWFNSVRAYKVERNEPNTYMQQQQYSQQVQNVAQPPQPGQYMEPVKPQSAQVDLPF